MVTSYQKYQKKMYWYRHRLVAMSLAEITHRLSEAVKRRLDRQEREQAAHDCIALPVLPGLRSTLTAWDVPAPLLHEWEEDAALAQAGKFFLLGQTWPSSTRDRRWHLDPATGEFWPHDRYCFDIDFRHADNRGDVKYVWELSRLQYLQPAAALACKRNDRDLSRWCLGEIENWIDHNPPYQGVNWASGIELALRAVSVLVVTSLTGDHASESQRAKIGSLLEATAAWIERYPSLYSSANNHRAAEGLGLFMIGALCPQFAAAERWRSGGWNILCEAAQQQILPDGVGAEQAISYTAVVLEILMLGLHIARNAGLPVPGHYLERIAAGGEYLRWFTDAGGNHPRIGDDDNARILGVYRQDETYVRSITGCIAALTNRTDLTPPNLEPHFRQAMFGFAPAPADSPLGVRHFAHGGYTVGRHKTPEREFMLAFDHGDLGYLSIAAHGHADALALWLHIDDQPVLVDAGTYLYHSGGAWREYFRSTKAHNSLCIDDQSSSVTAGNFNWATKAAARLKAYEHGRTQWWALATHDGYRRRFKTVHYRRVRVTPATGFAVDDMLSGGTPQRAAIGFLLHPSLCARQEDARIHIDKNDRVLLSLTHDGPLAATIGQPGTPEGGWYSPTFGEKTATTRIIFSGLLAPGQTSTVDFSFGL